MRELGFLVVRCDRELLADRHRTMPSLCVPKQSYCAGCVPVLALHSAATIVLHNAQSRVYNGGLLRESVPCACELSIHSGSERKSLMPQAVACHDFIG